MNERFKKFIAPLCDDLMKITALFIKLNLNEVEKKHEVINLILSAHISSIANLMRDATRDNDNDFAMTNKFLKDLMKSLSKLGAISECNVKEMNQHE
jgi:hypothetical protein